MFCKWHACTEVVGRRLVGRECGASSGQPHRIRVCFSIPPKLEMAIREPRCGSRRKTCHDSRSPQLEEEQPKHDIHDAQTHLSRVLTNRFDQIWANLANEITNNFTMTTNKDAVDGRNVPSLRPRSVFCTGPGGLASPPAS